MLRIIQRVVGIVLLILGIYLIFGAQEFFGTILIILAFLIFPTVSKTTHQSNGNDFDYRDQQNDNAHDSENNAESVGSDSGSDGGD
ncbi:hypothetical protein [Neobacillus thermocopriae]|uniref:hypothetical protein n=1 Tax=Neobacillus thermocopriae TaxID=1215031 RepID=UPI0037706FCC